MTDSVSFNARACFAVAADRIYRVELYQDSLYFLRIGGQFNVERGTDGPGGRAKMAAVMILAAGEALLRKHKKEELIAREPGRDPEELLPIHPHNFKLTPADIRRASLVPKKWFLALFRRHHGRLLIEPTNGDAQEYHFEEEADLRTALAHLPPLLGDKLDVRILWDESKGSFTSKNA